VTLNLTNNDDEANTEDVERTSMYINKINNLYLYEIKEETTIAMYFQTEYLLNIF